MKRIVILLFAILLSSCVIEQDHGYPDSVTFSKEGGTKTIKGKRAFYTFKIISDGNIISPHSFGGTLSAQHNWLTVKAPEGGREITLTAQSLANGQSRTLLILLEFPDSDLAGVDVIQQ